MYACVCLRGVRMVLKYVRESMRAQRRRRRLRARSPRHNWVVVNQLLCVRTHERTESRI